MKSKLILESSDVKAILVAAENEALLHDWKVSIALVDEGGHLLGMLRLDGASPMSAQMAVSKAVTSAFGRRDTKVFEDIINNGRHSFLSAPGLSGMLEGGLAILLSGQCVGAIGVSGVKSNEDVQIAKAGLDAFLATV